MTSIRHPNVAGMFYPADAHALREEVSSYLHAAKGERIPTVKAIVAPHAGYRFSGPVAGSAYAQLAGQADSLSRVVLLGPSHRVPYRGLAYSDAETFLTPLGAVAVDRDALQSLTDLSQVHALEAPFEGEHCLEVQLPFLQLILNSFSIVPLLVGEAAVEEVAEVVERLWGGDETLIVVSSDLSHYLNYENAREIDAATTRAIEALRPQSITYDQACGRNPLNGLLLAARRHALQVTTLDLRNSGDTAGTRDRVVGYGAYAFG